MLTKYALASALVFWVCCAPPSLMVVPAAPLASAAGDSPPVGVAGIHLLPISVPWRGGEPDLAAYVLPVPVAIRNDGPSAVDVQLADFVLVDERGHMALACSLPEPPKEATPGPPLRGTQLATVARPTSGDPDLELKFLGNDAPPPIGLEQQLALPVGTLPPGKAIKGFLYFDHAPLGDLRRLPALQLHYRVRQAGPAAPALGELELRLAVQRQTAP